MGKLNHLVLATVLTTSLFATSFFAAGCAAHRQVYAWGPGETTYYVQWEHDTHRDHVEWEQRNDADHSAYWNWRKHHR